MRERRGVEEGLDEKLSTPARGNEGVEGVKGPRHHRRHTTLPFDCPVTAVAATNVLGACVSHFFLLRLPRRQDWQ
jgi:hypothetical protein